MACASTWRSFRALLAAGVAAREVRLDLGRHGRRQRAVEPVVETCVQLLARHDSSTSLSSRRARCSWAFEVPGATFEQRPDLLVGAALDVVEDEDRACAGRQRRERLREIEALLRRGRPRRGLERDRVLGRHDPRVAPAPRAALRERHVHGQRVEPRGEGALAAEGPELAPGADEHLLRQLLGERRVARHPQTQGEHLPLVLAIEALEGEQVPGLGGLHQPPLDDPAILVVPHRDDPASEHRLREPPSEIADRSPGASPPWRPSEP